MGEAQEEGQWPRRHRSHKDENRALIAYVVLKAFAGRSREVNAAVGVTAAAFLLKLIFA
jgi:hypothetical protein